MTRWSHSPAPGRVEPAAGRTAPGTRLRRRDVDRFLTSPWLYSHWPWRWSIFRVKGRGAPNPPLWVVVPRVPVGWLPAEPLAGTGQRTIVWKQFTRLTATWREALDYATTGRQPRPLTEVYPEFCGVAP